MNSQCAIRRSTTRDFTPVKLATVLVIIALGGAALAYEWYRADSATKPHTTEHHQNARAVTTAKQTNGKPQIP